MANKKVEKLAEDIKKLSPTGQYLVMMMLEILKKKNKKESR